MMTAFSYEGSSRKKRTRCSLTFIGVKTRLPCMLHQKIEIKYFAEMFLVASLYPWRLPEHSLVKGVRDVPLTATANCLLSSYCSSSSYQLMKSTYSSLERMLRIRGKLAPNRSLFLGSDIIAPTTRLRLTHKQQWKTVDFERLQIVD